MCDFKNAEIILDDYPVISKHFDIMKDRFNSVRKFSFKDSKSDNLIQFADMVAGAFDMWYHFGVKEFDSWFNAIGFKKTDVRIMNGKIGAAQSVLQTKNL